MLYIHMPPDGECFSTGLWYKVGLHNKIFWWDKHSQEWKRSSCKTLPCHRTKYSNLKYFQNEQIDER